MKPRAAKIHYQVPAPVGITSGLPPAVTGNGVALPRALREAMQGKPGTTWGTACGKAILDGEREGMTLVAFLVSCPDCIESKVFLDERDRINKKAEA